jgi:hypothetical protein
MTDLDAYTGPELEEALARVPAHARGRSPERSDCIALQRTQ